MSKRKRRTKALPIPKWMDAHARKCKAAFGLDNWLIDVRRVRNLKPGGTQAMGYHVTTYRTLTSDIEYDADLKGAVLGHGVITHEFLHVALVEPDITVRHIIDHFVPKKHRAYCQGQYTSAKERTIESLARSLTPMLRAVRQSEGKKEDTRG